MAAKQEDEIHAKCFSPMGLKVLVVDDDPFCLAILERMLRECKYAVTTCNRATTALTLLRERKEAFDVVISDVHMPDMDGFKLLELIGLEMGLPVIMMSANGETDVVMKGVIYGACDYLVKPVRIEELRNIWQHVVRKRSKAKSASDRDDCDHENSNEEDASLWEDWMKHSAGEVNLGAAPGEEQQQQQEQQQSRIIKKKKRICENDEHFRSNSINNAKKARVVWSFELHQQFVKAINRIGIDKAVPKRILEVMNIQGLTRENVASHLQKYRLYLKRLSGVTPEPFPIASFQAYDGTTFGGTMQIQHQPASKSYPAPLNRQSSSPVAAGTLESLKQLQALQQAAHEKGQMEARLVDLSCLELVGRLGSAGSFDAFDTTGPGTATGTQVDPGELIQFSGGGVEEELFGNHIAVTGGRELEDLSFVQCSPPDGGPFLGTVFRHHHHH